jgi:hypothetical protein
LTIAARATPRRFRLKSLHGKATSQKTKKALSEKQPPDFLRYFRRNRLHLFRSSRRAYASEATISFPS